ncbi:hypothetical protein [Cytobacillus oceanisediminis]|uniref:Uncharacterized protein n=1 Tax=Cytobacillus oceanisediminis 2691 TaxID=1196031 RepID=A0A160MIH8_9BACI|nr:hypothetical protein [Cytobacillus oceanisediminis]AND42993.1 hypothetical protein A361_27870 [Cytobacillus oceanisediminis 2691]MCM3244631.1 hypothetical protein [Cytobacillus oceanisediminis]
MDEGNPRDQVWENVREALLDYFATQGLTTISIEKLMSYHKGTLKVASTSMLIIMNNQMVMYLDLFYTENKTTRIVTNKPMIP